MAFAVTCKSCQARFLLNDDLLRRKVAGKVVTVRCRQCHATIEVDASDMDPLLLPDSERPPQPALGQTRAPRPAPAPPRPLAKSTLMGIGAPRPASATELVALSPGLLAVKTAEAEPATAQGFPEPPPPPNAVEVLDAGDWDELETPALAQVETKDEPVPESLDDFAEELPPSLPPEEEMPSSTGTPSLSALTHHDEHAPKARGDDFLVNMTAAMNGGIAIGAPTIDVSGLSGVPPTEHLAPSIDVTNLAAPPRGAKTLPQFSPDDAEPTVR
ncbi:MAG TPA: MJ0042-type zinc finger domain-containing protein, partial [Polyangiaceae bacterium]|nr:MJ0042-type zinc finger domain-containing protein [Polyangiaceae bacterium]